MPDEPTLGEAFRRLERLETRLDDRVVSLSAYRAEREADKHQVAELRGDIEKMSASLTWISRAAITGVALPILLTIMLVFLLGGAPP